MKQFVSHIRVLELKKKGIVCKHLSLYKSMIVLPNPWKMYWNLGPTVALLFTCYFDSIMLNIKERTESYC